MLCSVDRCVYPNVRVMLGLDLVTRSVTMQHDGIEFLTIPARVSMLESLMDMMKENFEKDAPS
jgi:hypothetical protein